MQLSRSTYQRPKALRNQSSQKAAMVCSDRFHPFLAVVSANVFPGCVTCKAKRLKCDESKPSCQQCQKRNVNCGGYKKDFKWRAFEESTFTTKPIPSPNPSNAILRQWPMTDDPMATATSLAASINPLQDTSLRSDTSDALGEPDVSGLASPSDGCACCPPFWASPNYPMQPYQYFTVTPQIKCQPASFEVYTEDQQALHYQKNLESNSSASNTLLDDESNFYSAVTSGSTISGSASPQHMDQFPPRLDLTPAVIDPMRSPQLAEPTYAQDAIIQSQHDELEEDDQIEEIVRQTSLPSAMSSPSSSSSDESIFTNTLLPCPKLSSRSPEMLLLRFDQQTCGILSVKDGPTENPWRTMIWPLAQNSPALYHALMSMTAFHTSRDRHKMRVEGLTHMRKSIRYLASGIANGDIRMDAALATTLALAFSESWDRHITTGIQHLEGLRRWFTML